MSSFWDLCRGGSSVFSRAAFATGEWEEAGLPRASTPVGGRAAGQASPLPDGLQGLLSQRGPQRPPLLPALR